jgi:CTP synthase
MTSYIFITGGVVSSVGKGVVASALGRMLTERGVRVSVQKLDPYLNVDPGTMSPYQHGEVFVTQDGAETDLDLGHYERFLDINLQKVCTVTTGQIYSDIITAERRGDYLGRTIQVVPHITNEIKRRIQLVHKVTHAQVVIVEVGGTIGDIESQPFLEAIRQLRSDLGRKHTLFVHVTWLPYIGAAHELKTKPTQHSIRELRSVGITPDMIVARADQPIPKELCDKIALFGDVSPSAVVPMPTTELPYEVPLQLEEQGIGAFLLDKLAITPSHAPNWEEWRALLHALKQPKPILRIAVVGKYVELADAYISVKEALQHAALANGYDLELLWLQATGLDKGSGLETLRTVQGIVVPGGFGDRGIEGKILAAQFARENQIPYLGLCLGMQIMCIEFARHVLGLPQANSVEVNPHTPDPIIALMADQYQRTTLGGTMRLGEYPCHLQPGTHAAQAYAPTELIQERHRHRFEFNNHYREQFQSQGMVFSGLSPDQRLVEIAELKDHPFMLGSQFHPEFLSRPTRPHPLFRAFIAAVAAVKKPVAA